MDAEPQVEKALADLARREQLPESYPAMAARWFEPLADWLLSRQAERGGRLLVGLHGAQGTGKTTLCEVLSILTEARGRTLATLALDDFYIDLAGRKKLAATVHPLLRTRGVPGTHDTSLLNSVLDSLLDGAAVDVPLFDKAADDRLPEALWRRVSPADIVVVEGWCVGVSPQQDDALQDPVNPLEAGEDVDGVWRRFVNRRLREDYADLFSRFDRLVMLRAPSLECVLEWRRLQEQKLAQRRAGTGVMDAAAVARFVQHYERLTRHALMTLPARADYVLEVAEDHTIVGARTE